MAQCKQCGADLPENARFCPLCGAAVETAEHQHEISREQPPPRPLDFIQPALAGGMFLGFLSSLPFVAVGNAFCCMWVLMGGGIAAALLNRQRPSGVSYGDGAFAGVLSGLFGAIVGTIVHIPVQYISARLFESQQQQIEDALRQVGMEGPIRDWILRAASGEISAATILLTFFSNLVVWSLFAMIGAILTVAILKRSKGQGVRPLVP